VITAHYPEGWVNTVNSGWALSWNDQPLSEGSTAITGAVGEKEITVTWRDKTVDFTINVSTDNNITVTNTTDWNAALTRISGGGNNQDYTITVTGNVGVPGTFNNSFGSVSNLSVTLNGTGKLYLTTNDSILRVADNQSLYINGLVLEGKTHGINGVSGNNNMVAVYVDGGSVTMSGGEIRGNKVDSSNTYSYGGGVYITSSGSFTMSGGKISGNTASVSASAFGGEYDTPNLIRSVSGGGVSVNGGTFTISGGEISGNTAYVSASAYANGGSYAYATASAYGGGVSVDGGTFTMTGGEIKGNTLTAKASASYSVSGAAWLGATGGGVYVSGAGVIFTKTGGTITGSDDSINGNMWSTQRTINTTNIVDNSGGNAVAGGGYRSTTAGPGDDLLYNGTTTPATSSGAWGY
jgi:hypothetical protein